jgi:peptide/nickel transport system substrate-binding protein
MQTALCGEDKMNLNRWISILLCLSLFLVTTPWASTPGISSIVSHAKASELLPEGTRLDTLEWTQEYVQKILALEIWESRDSRDAFQLVKRGDFARWLVKARLLPLKESKHTFSDLDPSDPNYPYIMTALEAGIIEKTDTFRPKDPILRADAGIWLVNAHGDLAKKRAQEYSEPLIPAQDGYDGIPERAIGALSTCYAPDYQLMEYRHVSLDDFRYVQAEAPLLTGESAYSLYQLVYPPQRGGEVKILLNSEPNTLFTGLDSLASMTQVVATLYEGSYGGYDPMWSNFPVLIKRIPTQENGLWKINHDSQGNFTNMELTFELRKGLKWSDGSPLLADDFVFGHYLYKHPSFPVWHSEVDFWIQKVEALDDYTVKTTWNNPYLYAYSVYPMPRKYFEEKYDYHLESYNLNDPEYYLPPSEDLPDGYKSDKFLQDETFLMKCSWDESYNSQPLHAGPYRVREWKRGKYILLEPNKHYLFGAPLLEEIEFSFLDLYDDPIDLIIDGEIDMVLDTLSYNDIEAIKEYGKEIIPFIAPSLTWEHIDLNVDNEVLKDIRVRHALIHGIDREKLIQDFFQKEIDVSHAWLPPKHRAYDDAKISKYEYNINKSNQLLDEAGWLLNPDTNIREKEGKALQITFKTTAGNTMREEVQELIAENWMDIGVEVNIENEHPAPFFTTTLRERKFKGPTAAMYAWVMGPNSNLFYMLNSKNIPTKENDFTGQNYTGFQHDLVDQYTEKILSSLNKSEIYSYLTKIQTIVTQELPSIPLYYRPIVNAVHKNLANFKPSGTNSAHTWNANYWYWKSEETKTLPPPKLQISPKEIDFGTLRKSDPPLQKLDISNEGGEELVLTLSSEYPALQLSETQLTIPPRESKNIQIKLDLSLIESYGDFKGTLNIESNDPEQAKVNIPFKGRYGVVIQLTIDHVVPTINGEPEPPLEAPPFIYQGRTMVPIRFISEAFGAKVDFDPTTNGIEIVLQNLIVISMQVGNTKVMVNGKMYILDVPPLIRNARSFVPIRFISETFGAKVEWEASTQTITIYYKP